MTQLDLFAGSGSPAPAGPWDRIRQQVRAREAKCRQCYATLDFAQPVMRDVHQIRTGTVVVSEMFAYCDETCRTQAKEES